MATSAAAPAAIYNPPSLLDFDNIPSLVSSFNVAMRTEKGPISPGLNNEQITKIFEFARDRFEEMLCVGPGLYHLRPEQTGLARSVSWEIDEGQVNFYVHCNKKSALDQPFSKERTGSYKVLSHAFSTRDRTLAVAASLLCFAGTDLVEPSSSKRASYEISLQRECAHETIAPVSLATFYPIKSKPRLTEVAHTYTTPYKLRFVMPRARGNLFDLLGIVCTDDHLRSHIALQILNAAAFLHKRNVVHLDFKLENILAYGNLREIRVTDFGSALKTSDFGKGVVVPTPPLFLDPEAFTKTTASTEELYALNCWQVAHCLSELLFGFHPIEWLARCSKGTKIHKADIAHICANLKPGWYSDTYRHSLYSSSLTEEQRTALVALLDQMLHPQRSKRPNIEYCLKTFKEIYERATTL